MSSSESLTVATAVSSVLDVVGRSPKKVHYTQGIAHPERLLWDAWSIKIDDTLHLFTLSIPRFDEQGMPIHPDDRNNHPFTIWHFESQDAAITWQDLGPHRVPDSKAVYQAGNVWSGSIDRIGGRLLEAYTGIELADSAHPFIQSLYVSTLDENFAAKNDICISSASRDYETILEAGYYLQPRDQLGSIDGEEGGNITAWRDPFVFSDPSGDFVCFAAKQSVSEAALGMGVLGVDASTLTLLPPISVADAHQFTQLEVPKIVFVKHIGLYLLICATTNRISEQQPAADVEHSIRLYSATNIDGPWQPAGRETSVIGGVDHLFGATILDVDEQSNRLLCLAPYTAQAQEDRALTFAPRFFIDLSQLGEADQLTAIFD